jgi:hypothetical protein
MIAWRVPQAVDLLGDAQALVDEIHVNLLQENEMFSYK